MTAHHHCPGRQLQAVLRVLSPAVSSEAVVKEGERRLLPLLRPSQRACSASGCRVGANSSCSMSDRQSTTVHSLSKLDRLATGFLSSSTFLQALVQPVRPVNCGSPPKRACKDCKGVHTTQACCKQRLLEQQMAGLGFSEALSDVTAVEPGIWKKGSLFHLRKLFAVRLSAIWRENPMLCAVHITNMNTD